MVMSFPGLEPPLTPHATIRSSAV